MRFKSLCCVFRTDGNSLEDRSTQRQRRLSRLRGFPESELLAEVEKQSQFFFHSCRILSLSRRRKISQCVTAANVRFVAACIKDELRMKPTLVVFLTFSTF